MSYDYLPTIKQIIEQGDSRHGVPMDDEESREWFYDTCKINRRRVEEAEDKKP